VRIDCVEAIEVEDDVDSTACCCYGLEESSEVIQMPESIDLVQFLDDKFFIFNDVNGHERLEQKIQQDQQVQDLPVGKVLLNRGLWLNEILQIIHQEFNFVFDL